MAPPRPWWDVNPRLAIWMQFILSGLWCWQDLGSNLDRVCTSVPEVCRSLECCPENMIYSVCVRFGALLPGLLSTRVSTASPLRKGKLSPVVEGVSHTFLSLCSRRLSPSQDALAAPLFSVSFRGTTGLCSTWILLLSLWWFFFFVKGKHNFSLDQYLIWDPANLNHKHLEWRL